MAKPVGTSMRISSVSPTRLSEQKLISTEVLNKGMITFLKPTNIPPEALSYAKNARVRGDKTSRRYGKTALTPAKPDSLEIRKVFNYITNRFNAYIIRITGTSLYYSLNNTAWVALTGNVPLASTTHIDHAVILNRILLANGANKIQEIDLTANTISDLSDEAPIVRYLTGFAERAVGAVIGSEPQAEALVTLIWSGNRNIEVYDPLVDPSAGQQALAFSPALDVDPITGVFGLTSTMIITREKSLWLATKQPIARNPFNFYPAVPFAGADTPNGITVTKSGIYYYSQRNNTVFRYIPGMEEPEDVGVPDSNSFAVNDSDTVSMTYDSVELEMHFAIRSADGSVTSWVFNERTQAWAFDYFAASVSLTGMLDILSDYTSFEELTGTFEALPGTFETLSVTPKISPTLFIGKTNGDILLEDDTQDDDAGTAYDTEIRSMDFTIPKEDWLFSRIRVDYIAHAVGTIVLHYSKDGGATWTVAKTVLTTVSVKPQFIKFVKSLKTRTLMWKITTSDGLIDFTRHEAYVYVAGESQR